MIIIQHFEFEKHGKQNVFIKIWKNNVILFLYTPIKVNHAIIENQSLQWLFAWLFQQLHDCYMIGTLFFHDKYHHILFSIMQLSLHDWKWLKMIAFCHWKLHWKIFNHFNHFQSFSIISIILNHAGTSYSRHDLTPLNVIIFA